MNCCEMVDSLAWLRKEIIGRNMLFATPYGKKPLIYADYTASGRCVNFIENHLKNMLPFYANSHTEDDFTGKTMTELLHKAEKEIKQYVNAGKNGKIILCGSGATSAITRLQQILGIYLPAATRNRINTYHACCSAKLKVSTLTCTGKLDKCTPEKKPVVFVGPYEHHSNEIMWRQTLADVYEVPLNSNGLLDLIELEKMVSNPCFDNRPKIGSFSAASNVSGVKTDCYAVAKILHKHNAIACFDFAACAPYVKIDMNHDEDSYFDAIFLSPHKFLGGPGSNGMLVFNEKIYPKELPPTIAAGGTVDFVSFESEGFIDDIETREKPGTPGILQSIKAAMAFKLKERIGIDKIEAIEEYYLNKFYKHFENEPRISFYGPTDIDKKINIIPFNISHNDRILHPKFVTKLLNDLFGIQSRAGCSCAGPYGHRLLSIDDELSKKYVNCIIDNKLGGIKPGWVRLNIHYSFTESEFKYILKALEFIIEHGEKFINVYNFDVKNGQWLHPEENQYLPIDIDWDHTFAKPKKVSDMQLKQVLDKNIEKAYKLAKNMPSSSGYYVFDEETEKLAFFYCKNLV